MFNDYKKSGIIHKLVGNNIKKKLKTGISSLEIVENIENDIKKYCNGNNLEAGIAFPVGIGINETAAHFTPCKEDNPIIQENDIVKIDYGVHINGCITDGAFSWCPSGKWNDLINIAETATNIGIKNSGVDVYLGDLGGLIQEYIESQEIEIDGKLYSISSVDDLCGHKISPYIIHAGKAVPNIKLFYYERMLENEVYAIETFPTIGKGLNIKTNKCNHFMVNKYDLSIDNIYKKFKTLAFCPRWIDIIDSSFINKYPEIKSDNVVAQYEKTIYIKDKIIILN